MERLCRSTSGGRRHHRHYRGLPGGTGFTGVERGAGPNLKQHGGRAGSMAELHTYMASYNAWAGGPPCITRAARGHYSKIGVAADQRSAMGFYLASTCPGRCSLGL